MKSRRSKASPGVPATDMPVEIPASSLAVLTIRIPGGLWQIIRRRGPFRGALNPIIHRHLCHHVPSFHFPLQLWLWNQLSKDGTGYVQPPKQEIKEMSTNWSRSRCLNKENNLWWSRGCSKPSFLNPLKTESHQTWLSSAPLWYFTEQWYKANLINTFWFISRLQSRKTKCSCFMPVTTGAACYLNLWIWNSEWAAEDTLVRLASVECAHPSLTILCCFRHKKKTFIRGKTSRSAHFSLPVGLSKPAPCIVRSQHVFHNSSNAAFRYDLQQPSYHTSGSLSVLPGVIPQLTFTAQWFFTS